MTASVTSVLKPYSAYRESGVPWLGQVPEQWSTRRLKHAFHKIVGGSTPSSTEPTYWDGDVVWVTPDDVSRTEYLTTSRRRITLPGLASCSTEIVPEGSIVVTSRAPVGNVALASVPLCTNQGCKALVPDGRVMESSFAFLAVKTAKAELQSLATGTTFTEVSTTKIGTLCLPLPSLEEQTAIVRYLDHADRKVRHAIRARQQLVKLLTEQKQAIIQRAVTRGLDPNVCLKPSGVSRLGDVPEHWDIRRLKSVMSFTGGGTPSKAELSYWTGDIPWVSPKDMKSDAIADSQDHITQRAVTQSSTKLVPVGSILMVVRSGILQRTIPIASCTRDVALNQDMKALTPKGQIDSQYFIRLVRGCEKALLTEWTKQGATVESIEYEFLANSRIPVPPLSEQHAIVQYIDTATVDLDKAIDAAHREIDLLSEYRTRLIADVVTGKLDVRNVPVPDDETDVPPEELEGIDDVGAIDQTDDAAETDSSSEEPA
jgi:type I restriction enzyme, S subunit